MNTKNIILATDSYKLNHWNQYPYNTEAVYSYFESRVGARYDHTIFFGLQYILKHYLAGKRVTMTEVYEADWLAKHHFGTDQLFNKAGWEHIVHDHKGFLPVKIKAVAEGTRVPVSNVLMTVENTCPKCFWLTNAIESVLTHVWAPSTVATMSRETYEMMKGYVEKTGGDGAGLKFMLHDFGYRGASSHESAAIDGLGHLITFLGTDTLPAMMLGINDYAADIESLAFSVPATEHSVMTARGPAGEFEVVSQVLDEHPTGILSVVGDSYDIYHFTDEIGTTFKDRIMARDGKFVVRPDSGDPVETMVTLSQKIWAHFGGTETRTGHRQFDTHIGLIWGDGTDKPGIEEMLEATTAAGFAAENYVYGMGGGMHQKIDRDIQRFAFKCSAQKRDGEWHDIRKDPLDNSKASKPGRLQLERVKGKYYTTRYNGVNGNPDNGANLLKTVFEDGELVEVYSFDEVRENSDQGAS
jgi:nicotinamide phosphoribosyltransferase